MGILRFFERQRRARPLVPAAILFLCGMLLADALKRASMLAPLLVAAGACASAAVLLRGKSRAASGWLALFAVLLLGAARFDAALDMYASVGEDFSVSYTGKVISDPTINANDRLVCVFELRTIEDEAVPRRRIRLYLRGDELSSDAIEYGEILCVYGHVWPQDHATNPYQSDNANRLLAQRITGMGAAKLEDVEVLSPAAPSPERLRLSIRHGISARIDELFPRNAEIVRAFILGDQTTLDYETRDAFNKSGVAHLICISGLHISLLAMVLLRLFNMILPRGRATAVTLALVVVYGWLIGFPSSMVRAMIMFAVFSMGPVFGRPSDAPTRWAVALAAMLAANPFNLYDTGFTLSFSASAGILLLTEPLEALFGVTRLRNALRARKDVHPAVRRLALYFPALVCATLAAQLASLPFILETFHLQPLIALPVNLLAIPIAMAAYPLSMIALLLSPLLPPDFAMWIAALPDGLFSLLVSLVRFTSGFASAALRAPRYPLWLLAAHCAVLTLSSSMAAVALRKRRFIPVLAIALVGVSIANAYVRSLGCTLIFFDAGQADAALITIEGHNYIYDVGDAYTPIDDYVSAACLGVDAVFLSHPQYDHVGGLESLLEVCRPKVIYVPRGWYRFEVTDTVAEGMALAEAMEIPVVELSPGDELALADGATVTIYGAPEITSDDPNDVSLLMCLAYRGDTVFYTGDVTASGEPEVLPDIDILKVPHHGSKYAADERFLEATTPALSVISVGDNNYGHPSDEVLGRLEAVDSAVMRTDECGAITIRIGGDGAWTTGTYLDAEAE